MLMTSIFIVYTDLKQLNAISVKASKYYFLPSFVQNIK